MKILFYGARDYDQQYFSTGYSPDIRRLKSHFLKQTIYQETASLAAGYDGICAFVNADLGSTKSLKN